MGKLRLNVDLGIEGSGNFHAGKGAVDILRRGKKQDKGYLKTTVRLTPGLLNDHHEVFTKFASSRSRGCYHPTHPYSVTTLF